MQHGALGWQQAGTGSNSTKYGSAKSVLGLIAIILLDHIFITVTDFGRSIAFYERALTPLGIVHLVDYDGRDGPEGHPDLKGFGRDGRVFFWLRKGNADASACRLRCQK